MRIVIIALSALVLAGCATTSGFTCGPPLKQYSKDFQAKAADEYEAIEPTAPHITQMIDDYGLERKAIRACIKRRK